MYAKRRATKRNLDFNLTLDDIVIPVVCPVLGIPIIRAAPSGSGNSPSIDRFDNSKGYIKGNVYVISSRANRLKSNASIEELEAIIKYMKNGL